MPRKMSPEREREFEELCAYVCFYATHVWGVKPDSDSHPSHTIPRIIEAVGRSRALEGARQAANDTLEEAVGFSPATVAEIDRIFRAAGILTLSELRYRQSGAFRQIVKRGRIRNETEYYLVNGIVVDLANGVPDEERGALQLLIQAFEESVTPGRLR